MLFQPLLGNDARPSKSLLLGASSLISTFCQNDRSCFELSEVKNALAKLEGILGATCYAMGEEEEHTIIVTLKALRNIGILTPEATPVVTACYEDFSNTMEIRLAALDFARSQLCTAEGRNDFEASLKKIFTNKENDSELRIGAYLSLMNCPDESDVQEIKQALDNEDINQGKINEDKNLPAFIDTFLSL